MSSIISSLSILNNYFMTWGVDSPVNLQLCLLGMGWLVDVLGGGWGGGGGGGG